MRRATRRGSAALLLLVGWLASACTTAVAGGATAGGSAQQTSQCSHPTPAPSSGYVLERRLLTYTVTIGNPPDGRSADGASAPQLAGVLTSLAESRGVGDVNIVNVDRGTVQVRTTASSTVVNAALVGDRKLSWLPVGGQTAVPAGDCGITPTASRQCDMNGQFVYTLAKAPFDLRVTRVQGVQSPQLGAQITFSDATAILVEQYTQDNVGKTVALSDGSVVISAPVINAPSSGDLLLTGSFTARQQQELIAVLTLAAWRVDLRPS